MKGSQLAPDVAPEIGVDERDLVLTRYHGLSPMGNTDLDPILRNAGVTTIVAVGVSVNIAVTNLAFDAVNAGYQVVIPRDAVAGPARRLRRGRLHQHPVAGRHPDDHRRRDRGLGVGCRRALRRRPDRRGRGRHRRADRPGVGARVPTSSSRPGSRASSSAADGSTPDPAVGARFVGRNHHDATRRVGDDVVRRPLRAAAGLRVGRHRPRRPVGQLVVRARAEDDGGTRLRQGMRMGPAPSGLSHRHRGDARQGGADRRPPARGARAQHAGHARGHQAARRGASRDARDRRQRGHRSAPTASTSSARPSGSASTRVWAPEFWAGDALDAARLPRRRRRRPSASAPASCSWARARRRCSPCPRCRCRRCRAAASCSASARAARR